MLGESLAMFYSHTAQNRTTIDVTAFHFCVRNGNRWYYRTLFARQIGRKKMGKDLLKRLTVIYSHTAQNRTTIDVATFHFCVRNGNRWFCRAISVRQIG